MLDQNDNRSGFIRCLGVGATSINAKENHLECRVSPALPPQEELNNGQTLGGSLATGLVTPTWRQKEEQNDL